MQHTSFWQELPLLLVVALGLAFLVKTFVVQAFYIPSGSMQQTLEIGDRVLVNKVVFKTRDIERGDVVVFNGVDSFTPEVADRPADRPGRQHRRLARAAPSGSPRRTSATSSSASSASAATA